MFHKKRGPSKKQMTIKIQTMMAFSGSIYDLFEVTLCLTRLKSFLDTGECGGDFTRVEIMALPNTCADKCVSGKEDKLGVRSGDYLLLSSTRRWKAVLLRLSIEHGCSTVLYISMILVDFKLFWKNYNSRSFSSCQFKR